MQETQHLASAADFPFTYKDGSYCNTNYRNALPYKITGVYLLKGDQGLEAALASGPVASGVGFPDRLQAYQTGIYSNLECMNYHNHAVATVGYTSSYWFCVFYLCKTKKCNF